MNRKNNVLIILGMHRSGTSLIAQWLHKCGLHLGDRLIGASAGNEEGHYEDLDFHDLHERIFRAHHIPYGGLERISYLKTSAHQKDKFKSLIEYKQNLHTTWGWKDPRTCLFTDIYEDLIQSPTYLIVFRDANEVLNSLLKRREQMISGNYYTWRIITRFKHHINQRFKKEVFSNRGMKTEYTASWLHYNEKILNLTRKIERERYKVIHYASPLQYSTSIISWLNERNFNLKDIPFEDVFCPDMIGRKNSKITIDTRFMDRVNDIEHQFKKLENDAW